MVLHQYASFLVHPVDLAIVHQYVCFLFHQDSRAAVIWAVIHSLGSDLSTHLQCEKKLVILDRFIYHPPLFVLGPALRTQYCSCSQVAMADLRLFSMVFPCQDLDHLPTLVALAATGAFISCRAAASVAGFVVTFPCLAGFPSTHLERRGESKHPKGEGSFVTQILEQSAWDHHETLQPGENVVVSGQLGNFPGLHTLSYVDIYVDG